ncbi:MAG: MetQ/NlpA family ABC transporter substrate-binding protein [Gammaproteobacteria bacterium]|nr:MetQ/NlpA family ABC transporter substrate-binding protein [Gammaproteobacteria bacterium]
MRFMRLLPLLLSLLACHQQPTSPNTLTIGTISGPETDLVRAAQVVAKDEYGLDIRVVEFSDYNLPNEALQDGSLDANVYQHLPYLQSAQKAHGYTLEPIGRTFLFPAALYSNKVKSIKDLPERAQIAIPNDPSNETRALKLLAKANLITLKDTATPSVQDIQNNPKKLRFKTLDAAQLPRVLPDVDAAVINTTFAIPAGLNPTRDALIAEDKTSPYANLIVIERNTPKRAQLELFVKAMHSDDVKTKAKALFGDSAVVSW